VGPVNPPRVDPPPVNPRLVVELNGRTQDALAWLVEADELNKTTITNRAIAVYRELRERQIAGRKVLVENDHGGYDELVIIP
jgi:hypothetical protein